MAGVEEARDNITDTLLRTNEVSESGVYNITDRILARLDDAGWEVNRRLDRDMVVKALQETWNDYVTDTGGDHPDCFWREGELLYANFTKGNFAEQFTDLLDLYLSGRR